MLRINNIKVNLQKRNDKKILSQYLNIREKEIIFIKVSKLSIDARRSKVNWIISYDFEVLDEERILNKYPQVTKIQPYEYEYLKGNEENTVVVGSGPAGLFCAYVLANAGNKVTVVERGKRIEDRIKDVELLMNEGILNTESNIAFGEGGAGTFSDGKLTTGVKNKRLRFVLETFVKYGAPKDILYLAKPHIGTDYLREVIVNMRKDMENKGVKFLFETTMISYNDLRNSKEVILKHKNDTYTLKCDSIVLAIGHSARDTYEMLYEKGMHIEQKSFAVGVRLEQSQEEINKIQYKKSYNSPYLKAAPYKLAVHTSKNRGVYTFCMCPGGYVVPSQHENGMICVNGMSYYDRDGHNANSAILVNVNTTDFISDHPLAGIEFQRQLEKKAYELGGSNGFAPVQKVYDYFEGIPSKQLNTLQPSFSYGYTLTDLNQLFPSFINEALKEGLQLMNTKMPGFINEDSLLTGVEARSSAPVRIVRNNHFESSIEKIYPIGEGAGYAGGIMSAALDGILCAEMILKGE